MVTSWSDGRWEKQKLNIALSGKLLKGERIPDDIVDAISIFDMMDGVLDAHPRRDELLAESLKTIRSGAFDEFPEYKRLLLSISTA